MSGVTAHREQAGCLSAALGFAWHSLHFHLAPPVPRLSMFCLPNKWGKLPGGEDTLFQTSPGTQQLLVLLFCRMICVSMKNDKNQVFGALGASSHRALWQEQAQRWLRQSRCWPGWSGGQGRAATAATDTKT